MQGSEKILGFREIIFDSANFGGANQFVYVIFDQFYGDLHSYMKEKKRLDETEARHIFRQCVEAVKDCHQNGIIVRDIKLKKFVFIDAER
jgi:tribbles-like protein